MQRPVHFDMSAEDPTRAAQFYGDVFGWKFQKWEGPVDYWMITTGTDDIGINVVCRSGRMATRPLSIPSMSPRWTTSLTALPVPAAR